LLQGHVLDGYGVFIDGS
jgi:proton translocating ATP synthase F1 alpha subunit